jgi:hypothetical protein
VSLRVLERGTPVPPQDEAVAAIIKLMRHERASPPTNFILLGLPRSETPARLAVLQPPPSLRPDFAQTLASLGVSACPGYGGVASA